MASRDLTVLGTLLIYNSTTCLAGIFDSVNASLESLSTPKNTSC